MEPIISRLQLKEEIKNLANNGIDYLKAVTIISNKH
jgi:hypothetical protein